MTSSFNIAVIILINGPNVFVSFSITIILSQNILAIHARRKSKWKLPALLSYIMTYINIS